MRTGHASFSLNGLAGGGGAELAPAAARTPAPIKSIGGRTARALRWARVYARAHASVR